MRRAVRIQRFPIILVIASLIAVAISAILLIRAMRPSPTKALIPSANSTTNPSQSSPVTNYSSPSQGSSSTQSPTHNPTPPAFSGLGTASNSVIVYDSNSGQTSTPRNQTIQTTCSAADASNCYIELINGQSHQQLQGTVSNCGTSCTLWQWSPRAINLAGGSWKVYAVATVNGQTLSSASPDTINIAAQ